MAKLYVFGDSFSTPNYCVVPADSFWGLSATELNVNEIINLSWPGNGLENIVHTLLNEKFDFETDYFLIGIPPLMRNSIYTSVPGIAIGVDNRVLHKFDKAFTLIDNPLCKSLEHVGNWEFTETFSNDREYITYFRTEWRDVLSLEKIYLLDSWLRTKNAKFMIVNLTVPIYYQESWPAGEVIMKKVNALDTCILFENTFQSLNLADNIKPADYTEYGWMGHHGSAGNNNWYTKVIKPKMQELNWI